MRLYSSPCKIMFPGPSLTPSLRSAKQTRSGLATETLCLAYASEVFKLVPPINACGATNLLFMRPRPQNAGSVGFNQDFRCFRTTVGLRSNTLNPYAYIRNYTTDMVLNVGLNVGFDYFRGAAHLLFMRPRLQYGGREGRPITNVSCSSTAAGVGPRRK